jgi:outer membrane receptor protein involved in Fe transport
MYVRQFGRQFFAGIAVAFAIMTFQGVALAQDDAAAADEVEFEEVGVEEIIVTGSRLRRRDFNAPSPITSIDSDQIRNSGQPTLESALNQMPQVTPGITRTTNNGSNGGSADINLRGLGSQRTLVMLNGRRMAASGIGSAVDINNLPQVLIDRVEIITGGATTVYGSDAVSGVVNFITRRDFDGFGLDAGAYITERGDANTYDLNLTYGHNFANGRGNITVFGAYMDREELRSDARELTAVTWSDAWWTPLAGELVESGSSAVPEGSIQFPAFDYGNGPARTIFEPDGTPRELIVPDDYYNFAPENYIQTPLERYAAGFFFNYDLTERLELYAEGSYMRNRHTARLAPIPAIGSFALNDDNPLMTPETQQLVATGLPLGPNLYGTLIRRRLEELGPRIIENDKEYLRLVTGINGDAWADWEFDAWVSYTESDEPERLRNDASRSRFQQGILVDPLTGQCMDPSGGCVPIDWYGRGNISDEAIDFIRVPTLRNETLREQLLASAFVRGPLFETWDGAIESAFGVEWRRDDGTFEADPQLFSFDTLAYRAQSPVAGVEEVFEVFGEMLIPLADTRPGADYLALEIGGRYSDYKRAGDSNTWKAGIDWRPISSLRFRGMFQRSVRAPNLLEAFQEEVIENFPFATQPGRDPCSAVSDPVAAGNVEKCIATGLPAEQIGVFDAFPQDAAFVAGGNPNLAPEEAETLTLGVVIAPESWGSFQIAVDYFQLELDGGIGALDAVNACFDSANTSNLYCNRLTRDPVTFNVIEVRETNINRGTLRTTGFDTQISAGFELPGALAISDGFADLDVNIVWTHMRENSSQETPFGTVTDCAGYFGWPCIETSEGQSFPSDRVMTDLSYLSGNLLARLSWRWIDAMKNAAPFRSGDFGFPDPNMAVPSIGSKSYFDLGLSYRFSNNIEARLTIANLADTEAPNMADTINDQNTDTGLYDIYGRAYTLTLSLNY